MFLTTVMSLGLRVLRLLIADWRAGIASARSFSQSSLEMFHVVFVVAMVVRVARSFVKGEEDEDKRWEENVQKKTTLILMVT